MPLNQTQQPIYLNYNLNPNFPVNYQNIYFINNQQNMVFLNGVEDQFYSNELELEKEINIKDKINKILKRGIVNNLIGAFFIEELKEKNNSENEKKIINNDKTNLINDFNNNKNEIIDDRKIINTITDQKTSKFNKENIINDDFKIIDNGKISSSVGKNESDNNDINNSKKDTKLKMPILIW